MTKFLVVCNKNCLFWTNIFPLYMEGKIDFGYHQPNIMMNPQGEKVGMQGICRWLTTFKIDRPEREITPLPVEEFETIDNADIINTDSIYSIPDTDKLIAVPIGIIDYPIKDYEIIGKLHTGKSKYDYGIPTVNNKVKYTRVLIKRN